MAKNLIIGAGFSAAVTKSLLKNNTDVLGLHHSKFIKKENLRRPNLDSNKFFSRKSYSYGSLKLNLKFGKFHDRLIIGGNSNIWGGHINIKEIPIKIINQLKKIFNFTKLSFGLTGTISNNQNIYQIQNNKNSIFDVSPLLKKIRNSFILKFSIKNKKILVQTIDFKKNKIKSIETKKLFICVGVIQLLDLLYRSGFLKKNDIIEMSEFRYRLKFSFGNSKIADKNSQIIRYKFSRAIGHFLGIQKYSKFLRLLDFVPFCVDQHFINQKINYKLKMINNNCLTDYSISNPKTFGRSIHYCNLRINKTPIDKFLNKINPNILGFGMAFVNQKSPGPISNDIIIDIIKKIKKVIL
jgi:hypothetical protein